MDIEKLIEDLRGLLKQYGEKIPYGELVGAPWPYSRAGDLVWQDPEPYFIEQAATALSTLQAENEKLRYELEQARESLDFAHTKGAEIVRLGAELERMKQERDAAVCDLLDAMHEGVGYIDTCRFCTNTQCERRDGTELCSPQWRGPQKED